MNQTLTLSGNFSDTKPHYELLDGLRGVAAFLVLVYHIFEGFAFAESVNGDGGGLITTLNHGHIAVDFFFILSGFVVSYAYDDRWAKMGVGAFFRRRLIRLHPMLVMGALIGVAAFAFVGFEKWDGNAVPTLWVMIALFLTMLMIPAVPGVRYEIRGNGEMFPLNGPTWSLFFEYIGNILYALFIRRFSTKVLAAFAVVLGIFHAWFFVGDVSGYGCVGVGWTIDNVNFWGGLVRVLFPFTTGMLLARVFKPREVKGAFWICSVLLFVFFAVPYIAPAGGICFNAIYEVVCIAVVFPALVWLGACGKCSGVTARVNKFLGDLSYPLYIVHYPIMYVFYAWLIEKRLYTWGETWLVASLVLVMSIALAWICLKVYDEPVRRWLAGKFIKPSRG